MAEAEAEPGSGSRKKFTASSSREHHRYAASAAGRKGRGPLGRAGGLGGRKKEKKRKKKKERNQIVFYFDRIVSFVDFKHKT